MRKTLRKAMLSTICMLIVGVMSLTGVTYAWFTAGADATINNVIVNVEAADGGIQFSRDGSTWMSQVTADVPENEFFPVSTAGDLDDNLKIQFFEGDVNPEDVSKIMSTATTTGYYIESLSVRNISGSEITVKLQDIEIAEEALAASKYVQYASRIALVIEKRYASSEDYKEKTATEDEPVVILYEPFAKNHTENAIKVTGAVEGKAIDYQGVYAESEDYVATNDEELVRDMALMEDDGILTYSAADVTFTLANDEYIDITIYVWIEGQDVDCENAVSGGEFAFNLVFEKVAE